MRYFCQCQCWWSIHLQLGGVKQMWRAIGIYDRPCLKLMMDNLTYMSMLIRQCSLLTSMRQAGEREGAQNLTFRLDGGGGQFNCWNVFANIPSPPALHHWLMANKAWATDVGTSLLELSCCICLIKKLLSTVVSQNFIHSYTFTWLSVAHTKCIILTANGDSNNSVPT